MDNGLAAEYKPHCNGNTFDRECPGMYIIY